MLDDLQRARDPAWPSSAAVSDTRSAFFAVGNLRATRRASRAISRLLLAKPASCFLLHTLTADGVLLLLRVALVCLLDRASHASILSPR